MRGAIAATIGVLVVFFFASRHLSSYIAIGLAAIFGAVEALGVAHARVAQLRVSNIELTSKSRIEGWFPSTHRVPRAAIRWLEFQEDTTGPETGHHPGGLYAVVKRGSVCLLPHSAEAQTALAIERILEQFPDFRAQCKAHSPFDAHFTTLRLDQNSSSSS